MAPARTLPSPVDDSSSFTWQSVRPITTRLERPRLELGRRQAVRQRILIPSYGGSIPPAPATHIPRGGQVAGSPE